MSFWRDKRVFLTGHTGFKGAWLALWLTDLGAKVTGYSLAPPTEPSLFEMAGVKGMLQHIEGDVRDLEKLSAAIASYQPDVVIHMAAQSLVRLSYQSPVETFDTNVMGTVKLLEAVRQAGGARSVICVTSDKCYENKETGVAYVEGDPMGGHDPYSSSKGCSELVVSAYRDSYFPADRLASHGVAIASVRAGNVIGGGDWAKDRLLPDLMRGFASGEKTLIRFPNAVRPWQHVLEPLSGYMRLAERLWDGDPVAASAWNFGPSADDAQPVGWIADRTATIWGGSAGWRNEGQPQPHEAGTLRLNCSKARDQLNWTPAWDLDEALARTVAWYRALQDGAEMHGFTLSQIRSHPAYAAV